MAIAIRNGIFKGKTVFGSRVQFNPLLAPETFTFENYNETILQSTNTIVSGNSTIYGFDPSGTYFFWAEAFGRPIRRATATTPFDLTTLTNDQSIATPYRNYDIDFSRDGTRIFSQSYSSNHVYSATLSTPWDLTTISSWVGSGSVFPSPQTNGISLKFDGTKIYTVGYSNHDGIREYDLTTPWDVSTATSTGNTFLTGNDLDNCFISGDGTKIVWSGGGSNGTATMSTPWDLSTAVNDGLTISFTGGRGLYVTPDATAVLCHDRNTNTTIKYSLLS